MKILIAEDSFDNAQSLKEMFEANGYEVMIAEDGIKAVAIFRSHKIDLLFTDLNMPNMDGIKLTEVIRKENKDIPIFMYSRMTQNDDIEFLSIRAGATRFIANSNFKELINDVMKRLNNAYNEHQVKANKILNA